MAGLGVSRSGSEWVFVECRTSAGRWRTTARGPVSRTGGGRPLLARNRFLPPRTRRIRTDREATRLPGSPGAHMDEEEENVVSLIGWNPRSTAPHWIAARPPSNLTATVSLLPTPQDAPTVELSRTQPLTPLSGLAALSARRPNLRVTRHFRVRPKMRRTLATGVGHVPP